MTNEIEQFKQIYVSQTVPRETVDQLWLELVDRLPATQYHRFHYVGRFAMLTACLLVLVMGTTVGVAQAAKPNTPFYHVKVLSDQIVAKVTGRYQITIQKRADDVVHAAQNKSDEGLNQATKAYTQSLEASKKSTSDTAAKKVLNDSLSEQETKLRSVTPHDIQSQNLIHESIKATEQTRQDVKGAQATPTPNGQSDSHGNSQSDNGDHGSNDVQTNTTPGSSDNHGGQSDSNSGSNNSHGHGN